MRSLILSAALLSTSFLLGCQEQASSPVEPAGPGILLDKDGISHNHGGDAGGDNPGSETYHYTFSGDITTNPSTADAQPTVGNDQGGQVVLQNCCQNDETLSLSAALIDSFGDGADECFGGSGGIPPIFPIAQFIGELIPGKKVVDRVVAIFYFTAMDDLGNPGVRYKLRLDGGDANVIVDVGVDDGIFPPEPGETMTVTFTDFSIDAERKKEKNACSAAGALPGGDTSVEVAGNS